MSTGAGQSRLRSPSELAYQTDFIRRSILGSYWIVIFLALPLWWHTTSIERLSLPSSRVYAQTKKNLSFPVHIGIDAAKSGQDSSSIVSRVQAHLDAHIQTAPHRWKGLDVHVEDEGHRNSSNIPGLYTITHSEIEGEVQSRGLSFPFKDDALERLADTLAALIAPYSETADQERRVAQYASRYRLAFTLLNEDAAAGNYVTGWDAPNAIARHVSPILNRLSILHNFTIESQVQFHAPLAFKPTHIAEDVYALTHEDLTVFVNSAEWTLSSSVSNDPVLHFVVFVPTATRRPLRILDSNGMMSSSNAFLLPQWGGIVLYNPPPSETLPMKLTPSHLDPIFSAFANQLKALLGVPRLPVGVHMNSVDSNSPSVISDWQLDALLRRRALENVRGSQDTLQSIVKLVDQIENMPVGQYVKGDVLDALTALDKVYTLSSSSLALTLHHSAHALNLASRAFFNPGMLALLYFPAEHKYAVYTPLFASAIIPLIGAALREFYAWRKKRRNLPTQISPRQAET